MIKKNRLNLIPRATTFWENQRYNCKQYLINSRPGFLLPTKCTNQVQAQLSMCQQENVLNARRSVSTSARMKNKLFLFNFLAFANYNVVVIPSVNQKRRINVFCWLSFDYVHVSRSGKVRTCEVTADRNGQCSLPNEYAESNNHPWLTQGVNATIPWSQMVLFSKQVA